MTADTKDVKEEMIEHSKDVMKGKTGEDIEISPLEEARRLNEENKKMRDAIADERRKLELLQANLLIGGQTQAGQQVKPKDPLEEAKEAGKRAVENWYSNKKR